MALGITVEQLSPDVVEERRKSIKAKLRKSNFVHLTKVTFKICFFFFWGGGKEKKKIQAVTNGHWKKKLAKVWFRVFRPLGLIGPIDSVWCYHHCTIPPPLIHLETTPPPAFLLLSTTSRAARHCPAETRSVQPYSE